MAEAVRAKVAVGEYATEASSSAMDCAEGCGRGVWLTRGRSVARRRAGCQSRPDSPWHTRRLRPNLDRVQRRLRLRGCGPTRSAVPLHRGAGVT